MANTENNVSRRDFLKSAGLITAGASTGVLTAEVLFPTRTEAKDGDVFDGGQPKTPEEAAERYGGDKAKWRLDQRQITNLALGVKDYEMREWRYTVEKKPYNWPMTPEEAAEHFSVSGAEKLDPKKFSTDWEDPETGLPTQWHYAEDNHGDVCVRLRPDEVLEGYTANETLDPKDDRSVVVMGVRSAEGIVIEQALRLKVQGFSVWEPGTDPNSIALRQSVYTAGMDHPHYTGKNGEQLGPDAVGFEPVYRAPKGR
ncbi:MAG: twin-arginine translocation signal domain-containing protein [Candidatus Gottesmanbacteria bacterium]